MRDILSQGRDHGPGPWPRRLAVIAAAATALTVLTIEAVPHLQHHRSAAAQRPRDAATAKQAALSVPGFAAPGGRAQPDGVIGQAMLRDRSLRLPVAGERPSWFWPATGRMEPIGRLPRERSGYLFVRVGGGWAVQPGTAAQPGSAQPGSAQPGSAGSAGCGGCAGPPLPVYFLADHAQSATRIGTANLVAPAATTRALWLTSYPPDTQMSLAAGSAQEVSIAGRALRPPVRLPAGYLIDRATDGGLLLSPVIQRPGMSAHLLWDPAAARASRTFSGVIAANASEIAWTQRCARRCPVRMLDLATGRDSVAWLPAGSSAVNGAFSPGGSFLALQVSFGSGGDGGGLAMRLEVAAVASGHLTVVPGTWVSSDALVGFGWPGDGDSLVAELSFTTKVQVASWRPGAARLAVAVIRPSSAPLVVG